MILLPFSHNALFPFPIHSSEKQISLSRTHVLKNRLQLREGIFIPSTVGVTWWRLRQREFLGWLTSCSSRFLHLSQGKHYNFLGMLWCGNGQEALILKIARSYLLKNQVLFHEVEGCFSSSTRNVRRNQHYYKIYFKERQIRYLRIIFWSFCLSSCEHHINLFTSYD